MKLKYKVLSLVMFVMLICCVSAASAADVDNITVPDDTSVIEIDDAVDSVEVDEINENDVSEDIPVTMSKAVTVTDADYNKCFDSNGYLNDTAITELTFSGNFNAKSFGNFKINKTIPLNVAGATFNGVSFDLLADNLVLDGARFIYNSHGAVVYVNASNDVVQNLNIVVNGVEGQDVYAIFVENADSVQILNNTITYNATTTNANNYNYVIKVKNSPKIKIVGNTINAYLPLKDVDYWGTRTGMDMDLVAGIGIENSKEFNLSYNVINVNVTNVSGSFPTLDAVIVLDSADSHIRYNNITFIDDVTPAGSANYLYAIDVYRCDNLRIYNNDIKLTSYGGSYINGTINGTSAAYGIQLTGGYATVEICYNKINTSNNGPNAGIYSQNFAGTTTLTIRGNEIYVEGNAGLHSWSLVTGMELQDNRAYVFDNNITVNNKGGYVNGSNAYGISFSQYYTKIPDSFTISNNNITLINGDWAVYIQDYEYAEVTNNRLISTHYTGDGAVYDDGNGIIISGNHYP